MEKQEHKYRLTLEYLRNNKDEQVLIQPLSMEFENHDDIFSIIKRLTDKNLFDNEQQAVEFAIGLKLFSEVMLKNKDNLLFEDFAPALRDFMRKLKGGSGKEG